MFIVERIYPDGIIPDSGLSGLNIIYIYIYIYMCVCVCVCVCVCEKDTLDIFISLDETAFHIVLMPLGKE